MSRGRYRALAAMSLALAFALAQAPDKWLDPSPHRVHFVTLKDGARIEVLDWGGKGRPLVLLAGYLTAHAYDDFAPTLTDFAHVYGITRRGLGASSRTDTGYTSAESAADIVSILDELKLAAPVLAGHSFGGQDLSTIAAEYPNRSSGVVYLNSAEDPKLDMSKLGPTPPDPKRLPAAMRNPAPIEKSSYAAYLAWQRRTHGVGLPESELRLLYVAKPDGSLGEYQVPKSVRNAMFQGLRKPEYARIRVPVLAFFSLPSELKEMIERYQPASSDERAALEEKRAVDLAMVRKQIEELRTGVPAARIVEVPSANSYIFLSNPDELTRGIRAFMTALP